MSEMSFEGKYVHKYSNLAIHYHCRYWFKPIGVVYEADAGFAGTKKTRLALGVITWGIRAIPPRFRLKRSIQTSIDNIDIEKFRAAVERA
jgi:hypothetical protein